jgi:hypothetical protein
LPYNLLYFNTVIQSNGKKQCSSYYLLAPWPCQDDRTCSLNQQCMICKNCETKCFIDKPVIILFGRITRQKEEIFLLGIQTFLCLWRFSIERTVRHFQQRCGSFDSCLQVSELLSNGNVNGSNCSQFRKYLPHTFVVMTRRLVSSESLCPKLLECFNKSFVQN